MLHIILYQPQIPGNTGNIMRTSAAIGAKLHIIGPTPYSIDEKHLKRAGMNYIENTDFILYKDYEEFLTINPSVKPYFVTRYSKKTYSSFDFSDIASDIYLMFGREDTGLPTKMLTANPDRLLRIPMVANARSINLSNAVAIVCFEVLRQQKFFNLSNQEQIKGAEFIYENKH